ncbi:putative disease resistance protein At3g14460 [Beta vulgaris subsp. vulgaris]|uniref:putative disease resistance protein At3g14460 n=1 Tax=Beta vulgaris subsp. vulgaris TaxID=3555 RepID=UPI002036CCE7|nr:putative disease resistance protein At3g14460 [Beta vulgaris subsp. vulgaris]
MTVVEKKRKRLTQYLDRVFSSSPATTGRVADSRIQGIRQRLEFFYEKREDLGLTSGLNPPPVSSASQTRILVDESKIYGRDSERDDIIQYLEDGVPLPDDLLKGKRIVNSDIRVFAICGMRGIGKTTLAQLIYNHPRVDELFKFKLWICVHDKFDVTNIAKAMLETWDSPFDVSDNLQYCQNQLRERVRGNSILIVLDDVWDENMDNSWETLKILLNCSATGSAIIVTTPNEQIAMSFHPSCTLRLPCLSDEDCWTLFRLHAFGDPDASPDDKLEPICRELVAKCGGLPLAVKVLGGLLRSYTNNARREIIASIRQDMLASCNKILPELLLSYNYLPAHLKRCFAYCSIFPKNYNFDKEKLVLMWMAQGFIEKATNDNRRMEDIGSIYFHNLMARSFFQVSSSKKNRFVMHNLIHDLAVYVMGEFGFMLEPNIAHIVTKTPRHLSFKRNMCETAEMFEPTFSTDRQRLRTFLPVGSFSSWSSCYISSSLLHSLLKFDHLRSLSLPGYKFDSLPSSIGSLKYLRYLDFSSTFIKELPESICELLNLQTLLLKDCKRLRILPAMMRNLIHLRHLNIHGTDIKEMPVDIGRLNCLQTLTDFVASQSGVSSIRELGELSQLRGSLRISGLENVVAETDAFAANLRDKVYLEELVFEQQEKNSVGQRQHEQIMHALKPHMNLARLTIDYYRGKKFPDWLGNEIFCNLEVLHLKHGKECVELPSLGQLPVLKHLSIMNFDKLETLGAEFYGERSAFSSPFKSLLTLKIERLHKLKKLCTFEGNASPFPYLRELYMKSCGELEGDLPLDLPSLVKLTLHFCPKLIAILPDAPLLRELCLLEIGRVDITSLRRFSHLTTLSLCEALQVQDIIGHLPSVRELRILEKFWGRMKVQPWHLPASVRSLSVRSGEQIIFDDASQLHYLYLHKISSLQIQRGSFPLLHAVEFWGCDVLRKFPIVVEGGDVDFTSLYDLHISNCDRFVSFTAGGFLAPNLTTLNLSCCGNLKSPPNNMPTNFPSLQFLSFSDCPELELSHDYGLPPHLQTLQIFKCNKLITLPEAISSCVYLKLLKIARCSEFVSFPASGLPANLERLTIRDCKKLTSLPDRVCSTMNHLEISFCEMLDSSPLGRLFPSLESMIMSYCQKLCQKYADWQVGGLVSLKILKIEGINDVESFPPDGFLPTTLNFLQFRTFERLRSINCKELQRVINLREFEIEECRELILFSDDLPQSLCRLSIQLCDRMKKRCLRPDGYYVDKISHITCVELIDHPVIETYSSSFIPRQNKKKE